MSLAPRVVVVWRHSELDELLVRHSTRGAAAFFLRSRDRALDDVEARNTALTEALRVVSTAIPADWRRGTVERADLDRFLFGPEDVVVVVGPDGLVANAAKYLAGQPLIGVDPEPGRNPGVLVRNRARDLGQLLPGVVAGEIAGESRTMVEARLDDGQTLRGLNEVYLGDRGHQSARYSVTPPGAGAERQSSSGLVVGTGTGATGWCASLARDRRHPVDAPAPTDARLCWYVREAWPSPATGTSSTEGLIDRGQRLAVTGESERLVVFADGVESDHLTVGWGQTVTIGVSDHHLRLV